MSSTNKSTIAENIKKYRNKLGISQDKLSKLADVIAISKQNVRFGI